MSLLLFQGVCCALRAIKPKVYETWSGTKVKLWNWLENEIGNQKKSFEIDQSYLAKKFEVSRTTIINALKTFVAANLMEKASSGRGRGNHSKYRLLWTFREQNRENVTPSRVDSKPQEKNITKGSKTFRYYAYKFRTTVENSSLVEKAQIIVGKILNYLDGKPPDIFRQWLIYLKNWLQQTRTLKDFFVYFHDTLKQLAAAKMRVRQTEQTIAKQQKQKREVRKDYENNPPPKSSDFASFSDYIEAIEKWEESTTEGLAGA